MSIMQCEDCNTMIDTDYDTDHVCVEPVKRFSIFDQSTYPREVLETLYPEQI